jgi:hemoglobin
MTQRDLESRDDIVMVLQAFYHKVLTDAVIGHFFTQVVPLDLQLHLPVISDFWESVLFQSKGYRKNVMEVHQHIHQLSVIRKEHLDHWVAVFTQTIDEHFAGGTASLMKQRAASIATLMDIRLNHPPINKIL